MKPNIGISEKNLKKVATSLNTLLADESLLYTKTRKYHWNVQGPQFNDLHKFLEGQYEELSKVIDEVAERVRKLGHFALGSMKDFLAVTHLLENNEEKLDGKNMLQYLLDDHETIIRILREEIVKCTDEFKDVGTGDFLTGILETHETMSWMLRSFLS
ncbi:MAG: Dps family protein [Chitinophagaceae bacterium]